MKHKNDIVIDIGASIKLFADDTSLYVTVDSPDAAANILNRDLEKIHRWATQWLVKFNPQKTETLFISRKNVKVIHPELKMNGHSIQEVTSHKHLGIFFSDNGSWNCHIEYIVKKAFNRLNVLRRFRLVLDRFSLEKMYFSFVRPLLEYGDVIWDNKVEYLSDKIESVQIEAMRIVTGGTRLTSLRNLYGETGWEKLADRRKNHKLVMMHKMANKVTPEYLSNLLPDTLADRHRHFTRHAQNLAEIRTRTSFYSGYFLPSSIKLWNNIPQNIRQGSSLNTFKHFLKCHNIKRPSYYDIGSRQGQVLHARLRMESSSLNSHLFTRNIAENPNCNCGQTETTAHYLLRCHRYSAIRDTTLFSLNLHTPLTLDLLLHGSDALTLDQNAHVFLTVQKFIIDSKRFT